MTLPPLLKFPWTSSTLKCEHLPLFFFSSEGNRSISLSGVPSLTIIKPRFFLYLFVSAVLGGAGYFIYKTWVAPLIPARRRKPFVKRRPAPNPNATATGPVIDKSWIPKHHLPSQQTRGKRGKQPKQEKQT